MKILVYGSVNMDYVYSVSHVVKERETLKSKELNIYPGGKGLNQAIALSRAGAEVFFAGAIGEDGELLADLLRDNHIDITHLQRTHSKTGHAIIQITKSAENGIVIYPGANANISKSNIDQVLSHFHSGDILLIQNEISNLPYLVDAAYEKGLRIVLNPSPIDESIFEVDFKKIFCMILNEIEIKDIYSHETQTPAANDYPHYMDYLISKYPHLKVMLTLGTDGCIYKDKTQTYSQPIFKTSAVDATAAGDTFTGYFISEFAKGTPIPEILKIASCASSITVSRYGAAPSIPKHGEVMTKLKQLI